MNAKVTPQELDTLYKELEAEILFTDAGATTLLSHPTSHPPLSRNPMLLPTKNVCHLQHSLKQIVLVSILLQC